MRKNALTITAATVVMSIFGAFIRWLQNLNAFEDDTGLPIPGAATSTVFVIYSCLAAAVILAAIMLWFRHLNRSEMPEHALKTATVLPTVLCWIMAAAVVLSCAVFMFNAPSSRFPGLQRVFSAAGILMGFCLPFLLCGRGGDSSNGRLASVYATAFSCLWLIFSYKSNAENPSVWQFAPEILAICAITAAYYYICAYHYGKAKPLRALFTVMLAAYLSLATVFDSRHMCLQVLLAVNSVMMFMFEFVLIENFSETPRSE